MKSNRAAVPDRKDDGIRWQPVPHDDSGASIALLEKLQRKRVTIVCGTHEKHAQTACNDTDQYVASMRGDASDDSHGYGTRQYQRQRNRRQQESEIGPVIERCVHQIDEACRSRKTERQEGIGALISLR